MAKKQLSKSAYGGVPGDKYVPFVSEKDNKGGSPVIMIMGAILAIIFAASTAYSGMKAGLTVSAGIPGAILGSGMVGLFARKKGILGVNLLQGMSSGGEAIASGMIYVLPAIVLIGSKVNLITGFFVGVTAVLFALGVSSLVYNYLIVQEHGKLLYPESMAISEAMVASETGGESLKMMGIGFGIGGIITFMTTQFMGWVNSMISFKGSKSYRWQMSTEVNPMLLGIGFVIGLDVSMTIMAGSILANFAVTPLIGYFTSMAGSSAHVWNDSALLVNQMDVSGVSGNYVKYIGAGMMLGGGIIGAIKLIPAITASIKSTLDARKNANGDSNANGMIALLVGIIGIFVVSIFFAKNIMIMIVGGILAVILSFLFVIVSARMAGTIGASNNPVSGMTIASLVIMTLIFAVAGWTSTSHISILLTFGVFIVTAISVGSGYMQTQKASFIIGGNKGEMAKYYAVAGTIGTIVVVGMTVVLTPQLRITGANPPFALPQANLIAALTQGIMSNKLPWVMVIAGLVISVVLLMWGLPVMTIALGFYLPISTTSIIFIGALVRLIVEQVSKHNKALSDKRVQGGVSLSSGLIAGSSIIGLIGIFLHIFNVIKTRTLTGFAASNEMAWIVMAIMIIAVIIPILRVKEDPKDETSEEK
ncbi:OPT/YSL family transporter [Lentilactobacillus senioris]|uniref:OPT/YSL family transporter n=1 Tax=Lentilactobacillus senioris TaxID=931534 RepID=UPI00227FF4F9|nr:OPT/YSL family transporter [Lentilactobacillus senioris]MCY9806213.1 OPT/YSL family transporter [Lentilactobacillus senioris]